MTRMYWLDPKRGRRPRRFRLTRARVCLLALALSSASGAVAQIHGLAADRNEGPAARSPVSDGRTVDMQAAVDQALSWHPLVRGARSQVLQANEGIDAARSGYYPRISGGVNTRSSNSPITGYDSRHIQRAEISASQMLYDFGKVSSRVDQARSASEVARARVLLSVDEVVRNTAYAWIEVRRQEALAVAAQELVDAVEDVARLAGEREEKGASTRSDTMQARARVDSAQIELLSARALAQRWRTTLMHWMGASILPEAAGGTPAALEGACTEPAAASAAGGSAGRDASAIRVALAQLEVARAGAEVARTQQLPTLSLEASTGRGLNAHSRAIGERSIDTTVMLNLSMPLYEGGRLQADRRAAEHAVNVARAALDEARLSVEQGGEDAALEWRKFASRRPVQEAREESMRLTRTLYGDQYLQLGTRSLLDLLNAEQEYYGARRDQIDTAHEMIRLGIDCLFHAGRLRTVFSVQTDPGAVAAPQAYVREMQ